MTRQAVSRQIALLEQEVGAQLFRRTTARVELTPVGELYTRFFQDAQARWEETRRKAEQILDERGNLIRIGCIHDIDLGEWVLRVIESCRRSGCPLRVDWERREPHDLLEPLLNGALDVVFSFGQAIRECRQPERLEHFTIMEPQAMLVVRGTHPLAVPGARAADFQHEPCFISEHMLPSHDSRLSFQEEWARYGLRFTDVRVVANRETLQTMVEMGRGVTICTTVDRFFSHPNLKSYPLGRRQVIECIWRREESSPRICAFLDAAKQLLAEN